MVSSGGHLRHFILGSRATALRKVGVEEWLVSTVIAMYEGAETVVRTPEGDSKAFSVKVGLYQGSVLSPLLFVIVTEVITKELQVGLPWELLGKSSVSEHH